MPSLRTVLFWLWWVAVLNGCATAPPSLPAEGSGATDPTQRPTTFVMSRSFTTPTRLLAAVGLVIGVPEGTVVQALEFEVVSEDGSSVKRDQYQSDLIPLESGNGYESLLLLVNFQPPDHDRYRLLISGWWLEDEEGRRLITLPKPIKSAWFRLNIKEWI